jgi:hypothetical protein
VNRNEGGCDGFKSWPDLNTLLNGSSLSTGVLTLDIHPAEPILLTSELEIVQLISAFNVSKPSLRSQQQVSINIMGLTGIDVLPWPSETKHWLDAAFLDLEILFENSIIEFYLNGTAMSELKCSKHIFSC